MKIKALRVAEFGCFDGPVRIENFSGGLDVLAGPNELGKSTLLDALLAVFTEKHSTRSTKGPLGRRIPYAGGAPRVEVEFELDGTGYILRKQFRAKSFAELTSLPTNEVIARNDDAEHKLAELFKNEEGAAPKTALLWLTQGQALEPVSLNDEAGNVLRTILERGIVDMGGGSQARAITERIEKDLAKYITAGREQPTGEYKTAQKTLDDIHARLLAARDNQTRVKDIEKELEKAQEALKSASVPAHENEIILRAKNADAALKDAEQAVDKLELAEGRVQNLTHTRDQAKDKFKNYQEGLVKINELQNALATGAEARAEAQNSAEAAEQEVSALKEQSAELRAERETLDTDRQSLHVLEEFRASKKKHAELTQRIEKARAEAAGLAKTRDELNALAAITPELLARMEDEVREIASLENRLSASATTVRVNYVKDAKGAISLDGTPLDNNVPVHISEPVTLEIDKIGRVEIDPGAGTGEEDLNTTLETHRAKLTDLLAKADAPDIKAARHALEKRRELEAEKMTIRARLSTFAPDGLPGLESELQKLADVLNNAPQGHDAADATDSPLTLDVIAARETTLRKNESELASAFDRARDTQNETQTALSRIDEQLRYQKREFEKYSTEVPTEEQARASRLDEFETEFETQKKLLGEALELAQITREKTPDAAAMARLQAERNEAHSVQENHKAKIQQLRQQITGHTTRLEELKNRSGGNDLSNLEEKREAADARVKKIEADIAALKLLRDQLTRAMDEIRGAYFEPVATRIQSGFEHLFPDSMFNLGDDFALSDVKRAGRAEDIERLSEGTREQIAVLTRLGFARLLADEGTAMPLILDDALVFSDDARLATMFELLDKASAHHQIVMLTCREASFDGLGGTRLNIESGDF